MAVHKDQSGREIILNEFPGRIISLVPSITELLFDLNLENEVTGITKFCVHPEKWFRTKTRVGGTKHVNIDAVALLEPQLIIANKEENVKEQIGQLANIAPVWVSDVSNLEDALNMIKEIGVITNRTTEANVIMQKIKSGFKNPFSRHEVRTCYLIWKDPYMSIGRDTFIHDMLQRCGFRNRFEERTRYPEISMEELENCDYVLL